MIEEINKLYEYFFQISSGNMNFEFIPGEKERKMIKKFNEKLTPSHGEQWLFNYFCYQFGRYINLKTRFGKGVVMVGWIVGKKAFEKYKEATDEEKYWGEEFKRKYNVQNPLLEPISLQSNTNYKDRERKRFIQPERQLIHCSELSLYKEKNKICNFCKNKKECHGNR